MVIDVKGMRAVVNFGNVGGLGDDLQSEGELQGGLQMVMLAAPVEGLCYMQDLNPPAKAGQVRLSGSCSCRGQALPEGEDRLAARS